MQENQSPLVIRCSDCGSPADFRIQSKCYICQHCGAETDSHEPVLKMLNWRKQVRAEVMLRIAQQASETYDCANCGAVAVIPQGEALSECEFCGTSSVRKAYNDATEALPEIIIPFRITRAEALARLEAWCTQNKGIEEARRIAEHIGQLQGWYLPYNLAQGPISCTVYRQDTYRKYSCGGYIEDVAVNTSSQLDNELLDQAEPFDWGEARVFAWGYVAGHRIKVQDAREANRRVEQEIEEEFRPAVERTTHTTGVDFRTDSSDIVQAPALLPMYYLRVNDKVSAVVNGQTGKIAVSRAKDRKVLTYLIEPTVLTLIVAFFATTYPFYGHWQHFDFGLFSGGTTVAAVIFYGAFTQDRTAKIRRRFLSEKTARQKAAGAGDKKRHRPVFFEPVQGQGIETPVRIRFYSPGRLALFMVLAGVSVMLPALLAALCAVWEGREISQLHYVYGVAWYCLAIPAVVICWVRLGRSTIYDYPLFWALNPDGTAGKRVKSARDVHKRTQLTDSMKILKEMFERNRKAVFGFAFLLLFMLFGSMAAILS